MSASKGTLLEERKESSSMFNLELHELTVAEVLRNRPPSSLYEHAIRYERDSELLR
jgi:hypothetical protein